MLLRAPADPTPSASPGCSSPLVSPWPQRLPGDLAHAECLDNPIATTGGSVRTVVLRGVQGVGESTPEHASEGSVAAAVIAAHSSPPPS